MDCNPGSMPSYWTTMLILTLSSLLSSASGYVQIMGHQGGEVDLLLGTTLILKCIESNDRVTSFRWLKDPGSVLLPNGRVSISGQVGSTHTTLTIEEITLQDAGSYTCRNAERDEDVLRVNVLDSMQENRRNVAIVDPVDDQLTIHAGNSFTLKCVGHQRANLMWLHNGVPLDPSSRIVITDSDDLIGDITTSMLTRTNVVLATGGRYECRDQSNANNRDSVQVSVTQYRADRVPVEITDPAGSTLLIKPGDTLRLTCEADEKTQLNWYKDRRLATLLGRNIGLEPKHHRKRYIIILTREQAREEDSGIYTCANGMDNTDKDSVRVTVSQYDERNDGDGPAAIETRTIILQVGAPINLQCSLLVEADGQIVPEWSKDGVPITSASKYVITQTTPTELKIQMSERSDVGVYQCSFRNVATQKVSGIIIFNIKTAPCPRIYPPINGKFEDCPHDPVFGESCTFSCNSGYKLTSERSRVCQRDDRTNVTYWTKSEPVCKPMTEEDYYERIPTSLSHVLLRVGGPLKLQCSNEEVTSTPPSWTKHGQRILPGLKYSFDNNDLTIEDTAKEDTGIYDCNVLDEKNELIGIKKFNVTTLPCPQLKPPLNGTIKGCSRRDPVYGETCLFLCDTGFKMSGSRSRTCELRSTHNQVYWTGVAAECKNSRYSWFTDRNSNQRTSILSVHLLLISMVTSLMSHILFVV